MEIKSEIKAMLNYVGSGMIVDDIYKGFKCELVVHNHTTSLKNGMDVNTAFYYKAKLILKPLSQITDEDAVEVDKIIGTTDFPIESGRLFALYFTERLTQAFDVFETVLVYQFLQYKGYDLPQYLLGGKTLQESGLAIYEN